MSLNRLAARSVKEKPDWLTLGVNRSARTVRLVGNRTWAGQPVVNTTRVTMKDPLTNLFIDKAMMASWRIRGTEGRDTIVFGPQAGAITKRQNSVIDLGEDRAKDIFSFSNTAPGKPFNHAQRFVIKNFGAKDEIRLQNIGRVFRFEDLRRQGDSFVLPGVDPSKFRVLA